MEILLFGITREIVGGNKLTLRSEEKPETVGQLKTWLAQQYPEMGKISSLAVAVDSEYADDDLILTERNEIALIPPVSGG